MREATIPAREQQALMEVGRTIVSRSTSRSLVLVFLLLITLVPIVQVVKGPSPSGAFGALANGAKEGWRLGNRRLLVAMDEFETRLEDESLLREALLPVVQERLSGKLGVGNEQAYVGRGGWLFYRPDVDHLTAAGFLDPEVMERRRRGGNAWEAAPEPDPIPAIVAFAKDLEQRGIDLLVMPTPVKPTILPAGLVWRRVEVPVRNPSWDEFRAALEEKHIAVLDVAEWMAEIPLDGESQFLTTDTHWTPRAMDVVARRLAQEVESRIGPPKEEVAWSRREVAVEGRGDISVMLRLPAGQRLFPTQRVTTSVITAASGEAWQPDPTGRILLLGDSFTNVFSESTLGWGQGAGLAEQLSFLLRRPVDRLARNAGGSNVSRRALLDALVADPMRLRGKKVVIYQFAVRELSQGDWPVLKLPTVWPG